MRRLVLDVAPAVARRMHASIASPARFWRHGLPHEVAWWERWIAASGRRWPDEFNERLDPEAPLREALIIALLPAIHNDPVRILDVGAGPATSLGKVYPGRSLDIVAVDPLADQYAALWRTSGVQPPIATQPGTGERLVEQFGTKAFDIAYARNSLDHTVDPLGVLEQMLDVVDDAGFVVLRHSRNEATKARYRGLHQWNLALEDGTLVVRRPRRKIDLGAALRDRALFTCRLEHETITCVLSKCPAATGAHGVGAVSG